MLILDPTDPTRAKNQNLQLRKREKVGTKDRENLIQQSATSHPQPYAQDEM